MLADESAAFAEQRLCGGAFPDLDQIIKQRLTKTSLMGFGSELRDKYDLHMTVERFVSDENGVPDSDKGFIRK